MKYFRALLSFDVSITEIEVERETDESVWVNGSRHAKISTYYCFFKTRKEAREHIIKKASDEVDQCQRQLDYAKERLAEAKKL